MVLRVELHPGARQDMHHAVSYLVERSVRRTERFSRGYETAIRAVAEFPLIGREITPGVRRFVIARTDYALIYRVSATAVTILALPHRSSPPGYWCERL